MTSGDPAALVVVDTNVLLAATDRSRDAHRAATDLLDTDRRRLALTPQIVREYLAVATRPLDANGFGLEPSDAVGNVEQILDDMELLSEGVTSTRLLMELLAGHPTAGKQVHDANVVAVALAHHADVIVTDNPRHFTRFTALIAIEGLAEPTR
ncbi:putative nucleic acid-binding protein [Mumia flava]|uniref:Ribonuclease VapC n=1 Tax=Mumia flava TaxID=1348852 RepID=A0A0B2BMS6_9ACTN|nr:PIN domain-containing protein [Mumia flava]PJJ57940.1 putative nucleic acid-binding protein [Mumia flava]